MQISKKRRNTIFWVLQILGWGSLNLSQIFLINHISKEFLYFRIIIGTFTGILSTSLLRIYLRRHITFEPFDLKDILRVVVATIIASVIYPAMNYALGYLFFTYTPFITEIDLKILEIYNNFWLIAVNSLFIIFGWVVCYLVIKLLLKLNANRIERLELNTTLKQAQLNTLKGQINPHFMFNSLNNIRGLMLEDVEKSREMLTKLSEMLRYSLTKNDVNAIALEEELEMVDNYMDLTRIQFEDRLEFVEEIEPDTLAIPIPPMIIQLLVENAVKHGISNLKEGGKITITAKYENDQLHIQVKNSGHMNIAVNSTQLGLKNIKQRLRLLYGDRATFTIKEANAEVVANINIPVA